MAWEQLAEIRAQILNVRDRVFNDTNPIRTDYYLRYWGQHPEVPWVLLANLVSRNAGYQMSDLMRLAMGNSFGPPGEFQYTHLYAEYPLTSGVWALLETANFLILRDVLPQLEAYRKAKKFPTHSDELFDMLAHPDFDVDPFMIAEWKTFFTAYTTALAGGALEQFSQAWEAGTPIQRHSFALITNEQNQIEDRLINDAAIPDHYLGEYAVGAGTSAEIVLFFGDFLEATYLAFPVATSETDHTPTELLLYQVKDFQELPARIKTGRELYVNLFLNPTRSKKVLAWASANRTHHGTRVDYNPAKYSILYSSFFPGGQAYSPPLVWYRDVEPVWYRHNPGSQLWYQHLHSTPVPLPLAVEARTAQDPTAFNHTTFLAPLTVAGVTQQTQSSPLSTRAEIFA